MLLSADWKRRVCGTWLKEDSSQGRPLNVTMSLLGQVILKSTGAFRLSSISSFIKSSIFISLSTTKKLSATSLRFISIYIFLSLCKFRNLYFWIKENKRKKVRFKFLHFHYEMRKGKGTKFFCAFYEANGWERWNYINKKVSVILSSSNIRKSLEAWGSRWEI